MKCKKWVGLLIALALCSCAQNGGTNGDRVTVVLDWTPNTNHTGIFVAQELEYYTQNGLNVEIIQPPEGGALPLVASGKAQFAVSFQEEVLVAVNAAAPLPVTAVAAIVEHNTGGILSLKEKGITSFAQMSGKSYGSWEMPIYDEIVKDAIRIDGGDPSSVEFVPNSVTDNISGIQRDFDAVWVYEGWDKVIADCKGIETNFILFKDVNPVFDYYTPVLVTGDKLIAENDELVKKFLNATEKGYNYAQNNPEQAADILIKHAPESDEEIMRASQRFLSPKYGNNWGEIDPQRWNSFFEWMKQKGLIDKDSLNTGFSDKYFPQK